MQPDSIYVLLVEDSHADARILVENLRDSAPESFRVKHVSRLSDARTFLSTESPDVILLDLTLPDSTGLETVHRIRSNAPGIPIVVMTGLSDERVALHALRSGVQDYLVKGQLQSNVTTRALRYAVERAAVEKSLLASEERFRLLVDGVKDYAIYMLSPEGLVQSWNMGAQRIQGFAADEILGRHFSCFYPSDATHSDPPQRALEAAVQFGRISFEAFGLRKDGTQFRSVTSITALYDAKKNHIGFATIAQDLTDRDKLETQLRQAQKMEAIGQLTGGIAHDFNNILAVIVGFSELLLDKTPPTNPAHPTLKIIRDACEQASALTRQLLAFSRRTLLEPKVLNLNAVISENENMLRRLLGEDLSLSLVLNDAIDLIKIDPGHLIQVLMNVAINARDAMPTGGKLTIETSNITLDESYTQIRTDVQPGAYVLLSIADSGAGMTPAVKARIFEPFFTTKPVGQGTGLGLAVVHGIIKQSGGHIEVYSEPALGTVFKIYLPAAEQAPSTANPAGPAPDLHGTETILLVEDTLNVRKVTAMALELFGYTVLQASDGIDALRLLDSCTDPIDLLITDVVMPHLGGRELAAKLQPRFPLMKTLFMSGYTDDAVVRHGILQAHVAFLQKPFTPTALREKVRLLLDQPSP